MKPNDHFRESLQEAGISTLDDFVDYLQAHASPALGEALLIPEREAEPALPVERWPRLHAIVHRLPRPQIPLVIERKPVKHEKELARYSGIPLYYTPVFAADRVALAAFPSREELFLSLPDLPGLIDGLFGGDDQPQAGDDTPSRASNVDNLPETVCFFEHIHEQGDVKCLDPGRAYTDLRGVGRAKVLAWFTADWNDVISSVSACRYNVSLFEHINYGASEFIIPAGTAYPNLGLFGWNDRASSVVNWGP